MGARDQAEPNHRGVVPQESADFVRVQCWRRRRNEAHEPDEPQEKVFRSASVEA